MAGAGREGFAQTRAFDFRPFSPHWNCSFSVSCTDLNKLVVCEAGIGAKFSFPQFWPVDVQPIGSSETWPLALSITWRGGDSSREVRESAIHIPFGRRIHLFYN